MKDHIERLCHKHEPLVKEVAHTVWEYAELSMEEYASSNYLVEKLTQYGFSVQRGVVGYPTSFVAVFENGAGGPEIGLLCEYDALPGLGDANGTKNGHGCGHNLFAAGAVGTAIAMQELIAEQNLNAKLIVYGCPAEEQYGCKPFYAKQGYFDGLTCILGFHPLEFNGVLYAQHNAITERRYTFYGKSSHAGAEPEMGISALSALELMHVATNYLREHVKSDVRISYIVEKGGTRPNIVPDMACSLYNVRAQDRSYLQSVIDRLDRIAEGIAYAWGCRMIIGEGFSFANTIVNRPLAELAYKNLLIFGSPKFSEQEQHFVQSLGVQGQLTEKIMPLPDNLGHYTASTDEGDVSWCAPWIRLCTSCLAFGTPGHSYAVTAQADGSAAIKGMMQTIKISCATVYDLITDAHLRDMLQEAHKENVASQKLSQPHGSLWPDIEKFPAAPGVIVRSGEIVILCNDNPLLPKESMMRIYAYIGDMLLGEGEPDKDGQVTIKLPSNLSENGPFVLKYSSPDYREPVLFGYCQRKEHT